MEITQNQNNLPAGSKLENTQTGTEWEQGVRLTSSELASLWAAYMENSLLQCQIVYFLRVVEDNEILQLLKYVLNLADKQLNFLTELYKREEHPIPHGLRINEDINLAAPRLFTDSFILRHLEDLAKIGTDGYNTALTMCSREDVRHFFTDGYSAQAELYNKAVSLMLTRGVYVRPPYIPIPKRIAFVKKQNFLTGYLGKKRPLNSIEISHIFSFLSRSSYRKDLFTGYAQVAKSDQVKKHIDTGRRISEKHIRILSTLLMDNGLPAPSVWDSGIIDSHISPFSDRLMLESVRASNVELIGVLGKGVSVLALRHDLAVNTLQLVADIKDYSEDGVNILIDNEWFQEPPQARGREHSKNTIH